MVPVATSSTDDTERLVNLADTIGLARRQTQSTIDDSNAYFISLSSIKWTENSVLV